MKDTGYIPKIMGTASGLFYPDNRDCFHVLEDGTRVALKYTELFYLHHKYCHLVDDHNNKHHAVPSIEGSLKIQPWEMRVFQHVLATTETNCFLAHQYLSGSEMQILDF